MKLMCAVGASLSVSALAVFGTYDVAQAGSRSYAALTPVAGAGEVRIHDGSTTSRSITVPYSKSSVVELPTDMRDVVVANPNVIQATAHSSRRVLLYGAAPGQTNVYVYGHHGEELLSLDIRVERPIKGLRSLIDQHIPGADVQVESVNSNILLTGSVPNAATANRLQSLAQMWIDQEEGQGEVVNLLSVEGRDQVMLKVRIVEMQRSVTKQLGINLEAIGELGDATVSLMSNNGLTTGAGFDGAVDWTNTGGGDLRQLNGAIQALERVGLIRTLAEPTLTAISGETASFLSGGEFPLLTGLFTDEFGRLQRNFEFKPYGVSLGFTPVVLSEGRISLNISTEVSEPTTEGSFETGGLSSDILGLRVRRADSVVEMPAGGSLVIAGLIREETRQTSDGTPGLKNIPGLGAAFRNRDDLATQQELMIIVTPYLVEPTHPDRLQTPIDNVVPADDVSSLVYGRLNEAYGVADASGSAVQGHIAPGHGFGHAVD